MKSWAAVPPVFLAALFLLPAIPAIAASKIDGQLSVKDVLVLPDQPARIEAILTGSGLAGRLGLGGEQLELIVAGKSVAKAMTGGDGRAYLEYTPTLRGNHKITVKLAANPRVASPDADAVLGVWERRRPILLVEVAAVVKPGRPSVFPLPSMPIPLGDRAEPAPMPDAAEELTRLTRFFYRVIYISWPAGDAGVSAVGGNDVREWLAKHKFPVGLSLAVNPGERALNAKLDQLQADGWANIKTGIGRSRLFAEVLVAHRMDVVIVPEPDRGELPRKAKAVKAWKEIRKKL